ncbi:uncharacterized protein LOC100824269 [Brachypodium distachyon]|uniref:Uncharacterized protein n=1 Tax=Brachypodium distachyon TaxID=15368 RepID=A0A0Q3NE99_BRADI|nr:uncharacterized protein LOC100824269 [Brachypodium distachyon]KQK15598.1 hypothetical protein BRADI_1g23935v3 [Brachypodium distachyon]|eukprot:XP_003562855.1 uncharacterized protein LOC100824269 [Brachypodium distachyon]
MVFSSAWLAAAARVPAELCQGSAPRRRRRLRADEVLRALFTPPVQGLERLADCLFVFFCLPLPELDQYYVSSGRGGWMPRRPPGAAVLYSYRRSLSVDESSPGSSSPSSWVSSSEEGLYYSDD